MRALVQEFAQTMCAGVQGRRRTSCCCSKTTFVCGTHHVAAKLAAPKKLRLRAVVQCGHTSCWLLLKFAAQKLVCAGAGAHIMLLLLKFAAAFHTHRTLVIGPTEWVCTANTHARTHTHIHTRAHAHNNTQQHTTTRHTPQGVFVCWLWCRCSLTAKTQRTA